MPSTLLFSKILPRRMRLLGHQGSPLKSVGEFLSKYPPQWGHKSSYKIENNSVFPLATEKCSRAPSQPNSWMLLRNPPSDLHLSVNNVSAWCPWSQVAPLLQTEEYCCCTLRVMNVSEERWAGEVPPALGGQVLTLRWEAVGSSDSGSREEKDTGREGTCTPFTRIACLVSFAKVLNKYK